MSSNPQKKPAADVQSRMDRQKLRRWIMKAVADDRNGINLRQINKLLDSKEEEASKNPEVKEIIKRALGAGDLVKVDGKFKLGRTQISKIKPKIAKPANKKGKSPSKTQKEQGKKKISQVKQKAPVKKRSPKGAKKSGGKSG